MPSTKEIRRRIKGVKSTGKITRAMEMISAVKMRKATERVTAIRPYAESALDLLDRVSGLPETEEVVWLRRRPTRRVLIAAVTSHRGLCGSFNAQVVRRVRDEIARIEASYPDIERIDLLAIGRKGERMLRRFGHDIVAAFPDMVIDPSVDAARPVARVILDAYERETYDKVLLVYTDFVSVMRQEIRSRRLFPISRGAIRDEIDEMAASDPSGFGSHQETDDRAVAEPTRADMPEYIIEPTPAEVLRALVPRLIEMQLYHAVLESNASQEAARMMAMRNATDAAKEMADGLTLAYNQLRQARVTQEIAELSAGMAAVEN